MRWMFFQVHMDSPRPEQTTYAYAGGLFLCGAAVSPTHMQAHRPTQPGKKRSGHAGNLQVTSLIRKHITTAPLTNYRVEANRSPTWVQHVGPCAAPLPPMSRLPSLRHPQ